MHADIAPRTEVTVHAAYLNNALFPLLWRCTGSLCALTEHMYKPVLDCAHNTLASSLATSREGAKSASAAAGTWKELPVCVRERLGAGEVGRVVGMQSVKEIGGGVGNRKRNWKVARAQLGVL